MKAMHTFNIFQCTLLTKVSKSSLGGGDPNYLYWEMTEIFTVVGPVPYIMCFLFGPWIILWDWPEIL